MISRITFGENKRRMVRPGARRPRSEREALFSWHLENEVEGWKLPHLHFPSYPYEHGEVITPSTAAGTNFFYFASLPL